MAENHNGPLKITMLHLCVGGKDRPLKIKMNVKIILQLEWWHIQYTYVTYICAYGSKSSFGD